MTRIRIGFGTAVVATAVLFFLSGSYFTAGVFIIEILLPVVLRFFLRLETNGMELEMHTRSACRLGQTIEIDISVKSRWRCLAAARIQADLSYDNKMFQVNRNIPLALDINKRSFGISIPWEPKMCGGAILSLSNVRCYDIFGLNCIKTEFHQVQHLTVYPEKISMRPVASGNQKGRQNEGQQTLSKKGYDATEVFGLREYQPGDSIRTIHWKLSEKFDTVLVREPSDTSSYDILVMFDAGLTSGEVTYEPDVLSGAVSAAAAVSEKLMEHKVPHYLGMWAGNKIYLNQITGQQEYDNTMDTWMNLSLQKERGMGLKNLIAEKSHSNYRRILYFTAGTCPDEVYELAKDVSVTAVCILDEEGEVRTTERGMCVLTEIPLEKLTTDTQNIIV